EMVFTPVAVHPHMKAPRRFCTTIMEMAVLRTSRKPQRSTSRTDAISQSERRTTTMMAGRIFSWQTTGLRLTYTTMIATARSVRVRQLPEKGSRRRTPGAVRRSRISTMMVTLMLWLPTTEILQRCCITAEAQGTTSLTLDWWVRRATAMLWELAFG